MIENDKFAEKGRVMKRWVRSVERMSVCERAWRRLRLRSMEAGLDQFHVGRVKLRPKGG